MADRLKNLFRLPYYLTEGIKYHLNVALFTPKPRMIQFPVCDRCNSRCIMCNRWQKKPEREISTEKIKEVFSNSLFSEVEEVNLHGGEPTLRKDLAAIFSIIQDCCPKIKRIWISSNGFGPKRIEKRILEILEIYNFKKLNALNINISIDGLEETHDKIRGVKGGFKQCLKTVQMLKDLSKQYPINITIGTVIQPLNLYQIDEIEAFFKDLGLTVNFQPLMFDEFFNMAGDSNLKFNNTDLDEFKKLIDRKFTKGVGTVNFYWCDFLAMMNGAERKSPCAFDRYVLSLYPTGEVLPCSREDWILFGNIYDQTVDKIWYDRNAVKIRNKMRKDVCPTCSNYCGVEFSLQKEFFQYAKFYFKKRFVSLIKSE